MQKRFDALSFEGRSRRHGTAAAASRVHVGPTMIGPRPWYDGADLGRAGAARARTEGGTISARGGEKR